MERSLPADSSFHPVVWRACVAGLLEAVLVLLTASEFELWDGSLHLFLMAGLILVVTALLPASAATSEAVLSRTWLRVLLALLLALPSIPWLMITASVLPIFKFKLLYLPTQAILLLVSSVLLRLSGAWSLLRQSSED
jgi:hypothetical protein